MAKVSNRSWTNLFVLLPGKEKANMAMPWWYQTWSKKYFPIIIFISSQTNHAVQNTYTYFIFSGQLASLVWFSFKNCSHPWPPPCSHLSCPQKLTRQVFMGWTTSNRRPPALKEFGSALVMVVSGWTGCWRHPTPGTCRNNQTSARRPGCRATRRAKLGPSLEYAPM